MSWLFTFLATACVIIVATITGQTSFFIPIPAALSPTTNFGCPEAGTVFTYNVPAWNTGRPNRMIAIEEDQFNCRIKSDAQGVYDWFGGVGPHLREADATEKNLITNMWPIRVGYAGRIAKSDPSAKFLDEVSYSVAGYGMARVPAGLFWVYKIKKEYFRQNSLYHTTTLWWSPELKWTIRQWPEERGKISQVGGYNWELLSISSEQLPSNEDRISLVKPLH